LSGGCELERVWIDLFSQSIFLFSQIIYIIQYYNGWFFSNTSGCK
jgi:hypothetical protein